MLKSYLHFAISITICLCFAGKCLSQTTAFPQEEVSQVDTQALEAERQGAETRKRIEELVTHLSNAPDSPDALAELDFLLSELLNLSNEMIATGRLKAAMECLAVIQANNPEKEGLYEAQTAVSEALQLEDWLDSAEAALEQGRLIEPEQHNARWYLVQVGQMNSDHERAKVLREQFQESLLGSVWSAADELDFDSAERVLKIAEEFAPADPQVAITREAIQEFRLQQVDLMVADLQRQLQLKRFNRAEIALIDLIAVGTEPNVLEALRSDIENARLYGGWSPGSIIEAPFKKSKGAAPPVIVIPAGSFLMGASDNEMDARDEENPQHRVTFKRGFALGLYEITVNEFSQFVSDSGYVTDAERIGSSTIYDERSGKLRARAGVDWRDDFSGNPASGKHPVLHVSWNDANAYTLWLSGQTGKSHRLPAEAEFEYAMRAGSVTPFWWGTHGDAPVHENLTGDGDHSPSGRAWSSAFRGYRDGYWGPSPVGARGASPWGLHDMAGNVSEWMSDCWHPSYARAPNDGSAWFNSGCQRFVIRGGNWASAPARARSAARYQAQSSLHGPQVGFRIARELD